MEKRYPFNPTTLMYAPAAPGVYTLWNRDVLLFVGQARAPETVLERLMDHYCARAKPSCATHCGWELTDLQTWLERAGIGVEPERPRSIYAEAD